jgi:cell division protein FtsW (lipid II flippase)
VIASDTPGELNKQLICIGAGLVAFLVVCWSLRDLERAKKLRYVAAAGSVLLLAVNLVFGVELGGAKNWIYIGGMSFQPSELVKLCFIFVGASTLQRIMTKRNMILFLLYSAVICGCLVILNDFGTALIFFAAFVVIAYMRSGSFATIALVVAAVAMAGLLAIRFRPHMLSRFSAWGHVWENALTSGYQQTRAMMCIASGGLFGLGGGNGWLKYVAASDTDLVFAFVAEEWGLILALLLVLAVVCLAVFVVKSASVGRSSFYVIGACTAAMIFVV